MTTVAVDTDFAKNLFSSRGIDKKGKVALERTVHRTQLLELIAVLRFGSLQLP